MDRNHHEKNLEVNLSVGQADTSKFREQQEKVRERLDTSCSEFKNFIPKVNKDYENVCKAFDRYYDVLKGYAESDFVMNMMNRNYEPFSKEIERTNDKSRLYDYARYLNKEYFIPLASDKNFDLTLLIESLNNRAEHEAENLDELRKKELRMLTGDWRKQE